MPYPLWILFLKYVSKIPQLIFKHKNTDDTNGTDEH